MTPATSPTDRLDPGGTMSSEDVIADIAAVLVRHFSWAHTQSHDPDLLLKCEAAAAETYLAVVASAISEVQDQTREHLAERALRELSDFDDIGLRWGIDQASDRHDYLRRYERLFTEFGEVERLGLILGTRNAVQIANAFAEFLPDTQITAASYVELPEAWVAPKIDFRVVDGVAAVHRHLAAAGPLDVLIEDSPNKKSMKRELFSQLLGHVREGGLYIAEDLHASHLPNFVDDDGETVWELVSRLLDMKVAGKRWRGTTGPDDGQRARAIESVRCDAKLLVVQRAGAVLVKLRHTEEQVLTDRYGADWGRRLHTAPAEVVRSRAAGVTNRPEQWARRYPAEIKVPALHLREYHDVVVRPQGVLIKDNFLLPDTFRLWQANRQVHHRLRDFTHYFAWEPPAVETPVLPGHYYHLDLEYNKHFGHMMTEGLGRLWAWEEARRAYPDLKLLMGELLPYQETLLNAYGVATHDIHVLDGPVRVPHLLSAMGGLNIGRYISSRMSRVYRAIQDGLDVPTTPSFDKVFLTRQEGLWRECRNHVELERLFVAHGFALVNAEDYDLAGQAALIRDARIVAGYTGSGLYNALFRTAPVQLIGFVNPSYQANNEYLMASVLGHTLHQFWGTEVVDQRSVDVRGRPIKATNYDYSIDLERDGEQLETLLRDLDATAPAPESGSSSDKLR